jgi:hypothetical protein
MQASATATGKHRSAFEFFIKKSSLFIFIKPSPDHIGNVVRDISSTY